MSELKFITGHDQALSNLFTDVGKDRVVCYDVVKFESYGFSKFYPKDYLEKCTSVTIATSGDSHGRDWMVMAPYRVDESGRGGQKVYDIDPFVITFDANTAAPAATGVVAYHQTFDSRTSPISGFNHLDKKQTVAALRAHIDTGSYPISGAAPELKKALHHMADVFRRELS